MDWLKLGWEKRADAVYDADSASQVLENSGIRNALSTLESRVNALGYSRYDANAGGSNEAGVGYAYSEHVFLSPGGERRNNPEVILSAHVNNSIAFAAITRCMPPENEVVSGIDYRVTICHNKQLPSQYVREVSVRRPGKNSVKYSFKEERPELSNAQTFEFFANKALQQVNLKERVN